MRSRPHGSSSNFQRQLSSDRGAWNERAKRSRIFCSSPAWYGRITTSAGMRRFYGADGADVGRRPGAAAGDDADRTRGHEQRIGKHAQDGAGDRAEARPARGEPMPEELVVAILEVGNDRLDLESGMFEQLDQRGA